GLTTRGTPPDPLAIRFAVGRIVQEGVTNAMRHAPSATGIDVRIDYGPAEVQIEVTNDGVAMPLEQDAAPRGYGIVGLRERAAQAGGRLRSAPIAGGRWQLHATLPVHPDATARPPAAGEEARR
ncbi:MAG: histidine kinase, partial [Chloroflexota bacterium]|nr:histidine kinase [Chloroflexota bacterium]